MPSPLNEFDDSGTFRPGGCSLEVGSPGPSMLKKIAEYLDEGNKQLSSMKRREDILQYGVLRGGYEVREETAKFLTRQYGHPVDKNDLFMTCGSTQGLDTLMKHFFRHDQVLFVENPTYHTLARHVVKDGLMTVKPIAINDDGMDLDELEKELSELPPVELTSRRPFRAAAYVIATHHNPTGCCYSPEKCKRLVKLARQYELLIVCDDVYNALNYSTDPDDDAKFLFSSPRLFSYDVKTDTDYKGHVVANGSFSKIAAPGIRLGWYEAPKRIMESLEDSYSIESGAGQSYYQSFSFAEILKSGQLDKHLVMVRRLHKERLAALISTLESRLNKYGVKVAHPTGGCFLWIELPQGVNAEEVLEESLAKENVSFVVGNLCSVNGAFTNCIRLSIAFYEQEELIRGAEGVCRSVVTVLARTKNGN